MCPRCGQSTGAQTSNAATSVPVQSASQTTSAGERSIGCRFNGTVFLTGSISPLSCRLHGTKDLLLDQSVLCLQRGLRAR